MARILLCAASLLEALWMLGLLLIVMTGITMVDPERPDARAWDTLLAAVLLVALVSLVGAALVLLPSKGSGRRALIARIGLLVFNSIMVMVALAVLLGSDEEAKSI